jgi:hypothetical protein
MAIYQILYWKDIPAQIRVFEGRKPISRQMPDRFQVAIDRTAMEEGLAGSDDYLDEWQWTKKMERPGDPEGVLSALLQELETEYDDKVRKRKG